MLDAEQLKQFQNWGRYKDVDGDGIPYRTLPGNPNPRAAYFTRGTGHNEFGVYSERPDDWQNNLDRLTRKHDTARTLVPAPVLDEVEGAQIGIIAYGSTDPAVQEARDRLRAAGRRDQLPAPARAAARAKPRARSSAKYDRVYVVEMNQDGQMHQLVRLHVPEHAVKRSLGAQLQRPADERAVHHRVDFGTRALKAEGAEVQGDGDDQPSACHTFIPYDR